MTILDDATTIPATTPAPLRVLLADDHAILREGVRLVLEAQPDITVVGEASDGDETLALARRLRPDVVIMDIAMPGLNGLEATRRLRAAMPEVQIVVLTMHADREYVTEVVQAGAAGYVLKQAAGQELVKALRAVRDGAAYLHPAATRALIGDYLRRCDDGPADGLTPREREVLRQVALGLSNRAIANALGISVKTVEAHRANLMAKLDMHDRTELVRYAIRTGLISASE
jgi:DNA-binding NarL/FixJ family response regulator